MSREQGTKPPRFVRSRQLLGHRDSTRTVRVLEALAQRYPNDPAIWLELSHASRARGESDAVPYARYADRLAPGNPQVLRALALALAGQSESLDEALEVITRALVLDGGDPATWSAFGLIRLERREPIDAALKCERALAIDPLCVDAHLVLGQTALTLGGWDEATKRFRLAEQLATRDGAAADALTWIDQQRHGLRTDLPGNAESSDSASHRPPAWWKEPSSGANGAAEPRRGDSVDRHVIDAIDRHVDAYNCRDIDALANGFAPDAVLISDGTRVAGRDDIVTLFATTFAASWQSALRVTSAVIDDGTAACEMTETLHSGPQRHSRELVAVFTVEGGAIVRARVYRDHDARVAQLS